MAKAPPHTTFRLLPEDRAILDAIQKSRALTNRSETLRWILRFVADREGIRIAPAPTPRKR